MDIENGARLIFSDFSLASIKPQYNIADTSNNAHAEIEKYSIFVHKIYSYRIRTTPPLCYAFGIRYLTVNIFDSKRIQTRKRDKQQTKSKKQQATTQYNIQ